MIRLFVGFDQREAVAYHAFCQSVIDRATEPVEFIPLAKNMLNGFDGQRDGSNAFIYSRFLVPELCDFRGFAIFADGDMICRADIAELWELRDPTKAVQVVKHDYKTGHPTKYLGSKNEDYPRKNWSSLILWNCEHYRNRQLTPETVSKMPNADLHRFAWVDDKWIGELPNEWNWLCNEQPDNIGAKLLHYTVGTPCFKEYEESPMSIYWHISHKRLNQPDN